MTDKWIYSCPFCDSRKIKVFHTYHPWFTVECGKCFAAGPRASTQSKAIVAWNEVQPAERERQKVIAQGVPS